MRTTINLDDDTAAIVSNLRRKNDCGISKIVNDLIRKGDIEETIDKVVSFPAFDVGISVDVRNVSEVLDYLDIEESEGAS
jgi:hypothetical protein